MSNEAKANPLTKIRFVGADGQHSEAVLEPRGDENPFSSGKIGWNHSGKLIWDGKVYQVSCSIVEVHSETPARIARAASIKAAKEKLRNTKLTSVGIVGPTPNGKDEHPE